MSPHQKYKSMSPRCRSVRLFTRALNLNLDKIFLPLLKILLCYEAFFGNLIFAIIARMLRGNHLNRVSPSLFCY